MMATAMWGLYHDGHSNVGPIPRWQQQCGAYTMMATAMWGLYHDGHSNGDIIDGEDRGQGGMCPTKIREKTFFGQLLCKIQAFSGKNNVKFGNFVNFSGKYHKIRVFG